MDVGLGFTGGAAEGFNVDELDDELRDCGSERPVLRGSIFLVIGGSLLVCAREILFRFLGDGTSVASLRTLSLTLLS